jgi:VWFA-related protein
MKIRAAQILFFCECSFYFLSAPLNAQIPMAKEAKGEFSIKVGVEEVRIDAVVLDRKGHQITDLKADDFRILQDFIPQTVLSAKYIDTYNPRPEVRSDALGNPKSMPPAASPMLTQDEVQRTFVFLVDNAKMSFVQVSDVRMAMKKFVETQMQPRDLVAIVPTAYWEATPFQIFTSDKQHLLEMIRNLRYKIPDPDWMVSPSSTMLPQLEYCITALKNLPGRKFLIKFSLPDLIIDNLSAIKLLQKYDQLADTALRAGIVVHEFGLPSATSAGVGAGLNNPIVSAEKSRPSTQSIARDFHLFILAAKTGGISIENSNFFVTKSGISRVSEELKGYYLITYRPPAGTFDDFVFHKIKMTVKRPGAKVHTRDGFLGIELDYKPGSSVPLKDAIFSPFRYNGLNINLFAGYFDDPQKGYLLQSWLHLDAKDLSIAEGKDGNPSVSLTALCLTSDINNNIQDTSSQKYDFYFRKADIPWIREHGLKFSLLVPVKNPGAYYVRAGIKDEGSGKIGSAYQYLEIPNLKKKDLSLSNIFVVNREEDVPWKSQEMQDQSRHVLYPDVKMDPRRSPALRNFLPGETLDFAATIYNTKLESEKKADLAYQYKLIRDENVLFTSQFEDVDVNSVSDPARIQIRSKLALEKSIEPGDYILVLLVKNKKNIARQTLDFTVLTQR